MMPLTVGPILGAQTTDGAVCSQRIFVRGASGLEGQTAWVKVSVSEGGFGVTKCAQLLKDQDFTHVFSFQGLPAGSTFEVYSCTVNGHSEEEPNWTAPSNRFKTSPSNVTETAFTFGSCRSPDRGHDDFGDDRCFSVIADRHLDDDFILMCGDQIYADFTLEGFPMKKRGKRMSLEHFYSHYRKYFARPNFSKVTSALPTYMIWDDHEVLNNWSKGAFDRAEKGYRNPQILTNGRKAYELYQASLAGVEPRNPESYHYEFSHGRCDFFVMDQRMQRDVETIERRKDEYKLIMNNQMDDLKAFISHGDNRVKFIVSAVPMLPDSKNSVFARAFDGHPEERWEGYPTQRGEILAAIENEQTAGTNKNFIILSGDVHCSSLYRLNHQENSNFALHQITSSAFNWTLFPGLNDINFSRKRPLKGNEKYFPKRLGGRVLNQHNFCRVCVSDDVQVSFFDNVGELLREQRLEIR